MEQNKEQSTPQEHGLVGAEQGLRSGSTAGDSHGETMDAPDEGTSSDVGSEPQSPGERRKELLKEE